MTSAEVNRVMAELGGINRRLDVIEQRQDELRQSLAELWGGKKVLVWAAGGVATITGLAIAGWGALKG